MKVNMIKRITLLLLFVFLCFSCKPKKYFTDADVKSSNNKGGAKAEYEYDEKLSKSDKKYFAKKLDVVTDEITNEKLYIFIKSWEGTPYLWAGEDKRGIDCSAVMQRLYRYVYNVNLPRTSAEMGFYKKIKLFKRISDLQEGNLVFFRINEERVISHVGIYLKNDYFFSANSSGGCSITSLKDPYWRKTYVAGGRLKE
jgi:cell wall-associated NlpC family hydrolase